MKEKTKWIRNCPECSDEMYYAFKTGLTRANTNNSLCNKCAHTGERNGFYNKDHSDKVKMDCGNRFRGHVKSKEHIEKFRKTLKERGSLSGENNPMYGKVGELNPFYGKKHTKEALDIISKKVGDAHRGISKSVNHRKNMRISALNNIAERIGQVMPNYNRSSIPIIEAKANELGITDLQHAENGGEFYIKELGYWVDGYSKEKNIVIEYDEPHHKRQVEKDMIRQTEIVELLECKFIRIKE